MDPNVIPNVSVDCVVIGYDLQDISILLIEREMVYNGKKYIDLKLPGDLVRWDEDIDSSAYRILFDLSGVQISNLKQLQAFGEVDRLKKEPRDMEWLRAIDHPEERVITVAYYTLVSLDLIHSQNPSVLRQKLKPDKLLHKQDPLVFHHKDRICELQPVPCLYLPLDPESLI